MLYDKPLFGFGIGGFSKHYMNYQAEFLSANPGFRYAYLADDVFCPYNELLHIAINFGLPFTLIVCFTIWKILKIGFSSHSQWSILLVALSVFSLFSFPVYAFPLCVMFLLCSFMILANNSLSFRKLFFRILAFIILIISIIFSARQYTLNQINKMGNTKVEIKNMTLMKIVEKSLFLSDFYIWTAVDSDIRLSGSIINSALEISPSCRLLCISAKYSIENKNYEIAEQQLNLAANMIPGRLEPKRLTSILYFRRGDGNCIFPGDIYELYQWSEEGDWSFVEEKIADDCCIKFKNIPTGVLLHIKNISNGSQNGLFIWDSVNECPIWM